MYVLDAVCLTQWSIFPFKEKAKKVRFSFRKYIVLCIAFDCCKLQNWKIWHWFLNRLHNANVTIWRKFISFFVLSPFDSTLNIIVSFTWLFHFPVPQISKQKHTVRYGSTYWIEHSTSSICIIFCPPCSPRFTAVVFVPIFTFGFHFVQTGN